MVTQVLAFAALLVRTPLDTGAARIATAAFSIALPEDKGWQWTLRPDSMGLELTRHKGGILGLAGLSTPEDDQITVVVNVTDSGNAARGEEAVAGDYIDSEEADLRGEERNSLSESIKVERVEHRVDTISTRHYYVFQTELRDASFSGTTQVDQILYLYFPADLKERHQFFMFQMTRARPNKHGWDRHGFKVIEQVIESFRDERLP
jgi:hypothetical protein